MTPVIDLSECEGVLQTVFLSHVFDHDMLRTIRTQTSNLQDPCMLKEKDALYVIMITSYFSSLFEVFEER